MFRQMSTAKKTIIFLERRDFMSIFGGIITNTVYILFPLTVYIIYTAYVRNLDKKEKRLFLELSLYSSLYMLIRYGVMFKTIYPALLFNIPLVISFIKNQKICSIFISIILICFNYYKLHFSLLMLIFEYIIYFIIYLVFDKSKNRNIDIINGFIVVRTLSMIYQTIFYIMPNAAYLEIVSYVLFSSLLFSILSYIIVIIIDKSENIVNYNSTLNELNREKEIRESLFKITHEVKNPLAVCRGYLDMLDSQKRKEYHKYVPIISNEINRTLNLMDDFLDYTKVKVAKEDTDLYLLLDEIKDEIKPLLKNNNIEAKFNIPDDELYMDLDYNRIKQVFINIFKNSIEAKKDSMEITLSVFSKDDLVTIKVSDNGIGMDKDTLERIGENFFTTKRNGTGLGVSLSKEIISLHSGKMYYKSVKGKGTDVYIELPIN